MKIIELHVDELIPYDNNPRTNDNAVEYVANSIREFGFKVPIVIDRNHVVIAGHTRLQAAQQLGIELVPCIIADDLTDEQVKAFRIADNKVSEFSCWELDKLQQELLEITDIDMGDFGCIDVGSLDDEEEQEEEEKPVGNKIVIKIKGEEQAELILDFLRENDILFEIK